MPMPFGFDKNNKKHVLILVAIIAAIVLLIIIIIVLIYFAVSAANEEYQTAALELHNEYRKKHHADPLTLGSEFNSIAVKCAEYYADRGMIDHSCPEKKGAGENLYQAGGMPGKEYDKVDQAKTATKMWYDEVSQYDYSQSSPPNFPAVGHFTQVVWKSSKELGIGYAEKGSKVFVVGIYSPHGNMNGRYIENVEKP